MYSYGVTPKCPRCSKSVYAAEQIIGPGRQFYHKGCLKCTSCDKRLDSYTLLEHDRLPYCKQCHVREFGTKDLRQANLPQRQGSRPLSPSYTGSSSSTTDNTAPLPSPGPDNPPTILEDEEYSIPELYRSESSASSRPESSTARTRPLPPPLHRATLSADIDMHPTIEAELAADPVLQPLTHTQTGSRYGAALGGRTTGWRGCRCMTGAGLRATPTGNKWTPSANPQCPRCGKSVYFAEQVRAASRTYHKGCLRCFSCSTSLDSSKIRDHDGEIVCVRCYSKLHGPAGRGYALLGKAGG
ncbi:hypothetical protein BD626DRAFT_506075 [Schizophyllum amplum]|uniref:LIM zinc-binding domain-containing protein n=1 Tax=Schizophyllum amplum TaxID=97359 RepID=A0A550C5A0_9AGAR|nr:hypothetical protein BD626DRAFT_506075 [Auriculariopsis ampla]